MKKLFVILLCATPFMAWSDTNDLERARQAYIEARNAYQAARRAAGLTNTVKRAATTATVFTKSQKRFFENRRICVSRDTTTIPGSVITTWYRNGRPDTKAPAVVTNVLKNVAGVLQNNPLQARLEELGEQYREAMSDFQSVMHDTVERYNAATNSLAAAEARAARADALKSWLVEQRDKALLESTKKIYQAIIDRLEGE